MGDILPFEQVRPKRKSPRRWHGLSRRMVEILEAAEDYDINSERPLPNYYEPTTSALRRRGLLAFCDALAKPTMEQIELRGWVLTPAGRATLRKLRVS